MLRCILKNISKYVIIFCSNYAFNVKIVFKQWLQVLKNVNYVFFTH